MIDETRVIPRGVTWTGVRQLALTVCAGALGFVLALSVWTLWTDHWVLQTLVQIESQRQAASRAPMLPAPEGRR